jgi:hypothetical protein
MRFTVVTPPASSSLPPAAEKAVQLVIVLRLARSTKGLAPNLSARRFHFAMVASGSAFQFADEFLYPQVIVCILVMDRYRCSYDGENESQN